MLEHLVASRRTRRRRGPAVALSLAAHVAAVSAFLVHAAWQVDRLEAPDRPILVAAGFVSSPAMPEGPPRKDPPGPKDSTRQVVAVPHLVAKATEQPPGAGRTDGQPGPVEGGGCAPDAGCAPGPTAPPPEPVCGNGVVEQDEACDDGGNAPGDGCTATCRVERAIVVAPRLIEGQRIAGDPQIPPPESVRSQMMRSGRTEAIGSVKMCLTANGRVDSLRVLRSTGHAAYDQLLTSRMREWRYRPYRTGAGDPVPVCTLVTFIYRMR